MKTVAIIVGSVRSERVGLSVCKWIMRKTENYEGNLLFKLIDLKKINLPFLDEPVPARMSNEYVHEHTRQWSRIIQETDAVIMVTPEYNSSYAPALKNAIDYLYHEWQNMPVGIVGYGGGSGTRAIHKLRDVLISVGMKPLDCQIIINNIRDALDKSENIKAEFIDGNIHELFRQLETFSI